MNANANWPGSINYAHSNYTGKVPRVSRYDGQGGWAKDSSSPKCGWGLAILGTVAVVSVLAGVVFIGAAVGIQ